MAVKSVPHSKSPRKDSKAPVAGDQRRGPVSTRLHGVRSPGVSETPGRNNSPEGGKFGTVPNSTKS